MRVRQWSRAGLVAVVATGLVGTLVAPAAAGPSDPAGVAPPPGGRFFDDDGNTHEGAIEAIATAEITVGCNAPYQTGYCPSDDVTRAQMATFLARALDLPVPTGNRFSDVSGTHSGNINAIAEAGITLGCDATGTRYCPDDLVTRAQMGSFLARGLGLAAVGDNRFSDVSGTHSGNINAIAEAGITLGCDATGTRYCPDDLVRRDQMASFLARGLDLPIIAPAERIVDGTGMFIELFDLAAAAGCTEETGEVCVVAADVGQDGFVIDTGWTTSNWSAQSAADQDAFLSDQIGVAVTFDGFAIDLVEFEPYLDGDTMIKEVAYAWPAWLQGDHVIEVFFFDYTVSDIYEWTLIVNVSPTGAGYPLARRANGTASLKAR